MSEVRWNNSWLDDLKSILTKMTMTIVTVVLSKYFRVIE